MKKFVAFYLCTYISPLFRDISHSSIVFCSKIIKYQILHLFSLSTCFIMLSTSNELQHEKTCLKIHDKLMVIIGPVDIFPSNMGPYKSGEKARMQRVLDIPVHLIVSSDLPRRGWPCRGGSRTQKGSQKAAANWERILKGIFTSSNNVNRTPYIIFV